MCSLVIHSAIVSVSSNDREKSLKTYKITWVSLGSIHFHGSHLIPTSPLALGPGVIAMEICIFGDNFSGSSLS